MPHWAERMGRVVIIFTPWPDINVCLPLLGGVILPAAAVGQVLGGLVARWRRLQVRGLLIQAAVGCALAGLLSPVFLLKCDQPKIAGVTVSYDG